MIVHEASSFIGPGLLGNPAGVCLLDAPGDPSAMQSLAAKIGHAETAFVCPEDGGWRLRWFTPEVEVDLCGHATLAAAWVMSEKGVAAGQITFLSRSGPLAAEVHHDGRVTLDFPALRPSQESLPSHLAPLQEISAWTGRSRDDWMAVLPGAEFVRAFQPDFEGISGAGMRGLMITAPGEDRWRAVSRFFAPQSGVPEDHVTGSAHCALAPYWLNDGEEALFLQASQRGGELTVKLSGERALLTGAVEWLNS